MSNPFVRHEEAAPISDVNVVPLADVSLVLLIILLVLSPMAAQSMLRVQTAAAKAIRRLGKFSIGQTAIKLFVMPNARQQQCRPGQHAVIGHPDPAHQIMAQRRT